MGLDCTFEFVNGACGSVFLCQNNECSVLCTVQGPKEVRFNAELIDRATIEVTYIPSNCVPEPSVRLISVYLKRLAQKMIIATMYPRSLILITIQQIKGDQHLLSACINAMCLALANASIPLHAMFCGLPVKLSSGGVVNVTRCNNSNEPLSVHFSNGVATKNDIKEAYTKSQEEADKMFNNTRFGTP